MRRLIIFTLLTYSVTAIQAQTKSCCSAHDEFTAFTGDKAFVDKHDEPIPFNYISEKGKMVSYPCPDGIEAYAFLIPAEIESDQYLFVFHEWWGLNDYIKQMAEQFYNDMNKNINVMAIDLYDGRWTASKDTAQKMMNNLDQARAKNIIQGAINKVGPDANVGTVGWCMGGGFSLQASIMLKQQGAACVMYYGFPETDKEKLKDLNADVFMVWPNKDKWINNEVVTQFKTDMLALNKSIHIEEYDADHAFANPSNPKYSKEMADDAYAKVIKFLRERLERT